MSWVLDLLVSIYPIIITSKYVVIYANHGPPKAAKNTNFLIVWWGSFGILDLTEKLTGISNIPMYSLVKTGFLSMLYITSYRESLIKKSCEFIDLAKIKINESEVYRNITDFFSMNPNQYLRKNQPVDVVEVGDGDGDDDVIVGNSNDNPSMINGLTNGIRRLVGW